MNTGRPVSILLVDDDEVDVMAVRRAFATRAPRIRSARDGREALAILRGQGVPPIAKPYLILLDLNGYVVKSRAGQDLSGLVSLIDCYQSTVELP